MKIKKTEIPVVVEGKINIVKDEVEHTKALLDYNIMMGVIDDPSEESEENEEETEDE